MADNATGNATTNRFLNVRIQERIIDSTNVDGISLLPGEKVIVKNKDNSYSEIFGLADGTKANTLDKINTDIAKIKKEVGITTDGSTTGTSIKNKVDNIGNEIFLPGSDVDRKIVLTRSFGNRIVSEGSSKEFSIGTNESLLDWILDSFRDELSPLNAKLPEVSITANSTNTGKDLEIGSYFNNIKYTVEFTDGKYNLGTIEKEINSTVIGCVIKYGTENKYDSPSIPVGNKEFTIAQQLQIDSTSEKEYGDEITATIVLRNDGSSVTNNLNSPDADFFKKYGFDENNSLTITSNCKIKVKGYRNTWYYIGTDDAFTLNSDNIRAKFTSKNTSTTEFGTLIIPNGTTRIAFAVLGNRTLESVIDIDGQNLDVKANFTKETIAINGANNFASANYSVFHFENPKGIAATRYTIKIK